MRSDVFLPIMSTKIIRCNCTHKIQDGLYGVGNRVANEMKNGQFRCTVCDTIVGSQSVQIAKVKEPVKEQVKEKIEKEVDKKGKPTVKKERRYSLKGGKR